MNRSASTTSNGRQVGSGEPPGPAVDADCARAADDRPVQFEYAIALQRRGFGIWLLVRRLPAPGYRGHQGQHTEQQGLRQQGDAREYQQQETHGRGRETQPHSLRCSG